MLAVGSSNRLDWIAISPTLLSDDKHVLATFLLKDERMMKALIRDRYGPPDVLEVRDIERPAPKEGEVLVRVHAASINDWDWQMLRRQLIPVPYPLSSCHFDSVALPQWQRFGTIVLTPPLLSAMLAVGQKKLIHCLYLRRPIPVRESRGPLCGTDATICVE